MRIPYSDETEMDVIRLIMEGHTYAEINKMTGVSPGTISEMKNRFADRLGRKDVEAICEFAKNLKKNGISYSDAFSGSRIFSILKKINIDLENFYDFVKKIFGKCQKKNLDPEKLVEYSSKLFTIQEQLGVPLEQVPVECENLLNEKKTLEKEILQLTEDAKKARTDAETSLTENDLTKKQVRDYVEVKSKLTGFDVDLDLENLSILVKNAKENNYDIEKIIKHLEKEEEYGQRIEKIRHKLEENETKNASLVSQNKKLSNIIDSQKSRVVQLEKLEGLDITSEHLDGLFITVQNIAKVHSVDAKEAFFRLHEDLKNNYDKIIGLKSHLAKLENDTLLKSKELETIVVKIEKFKIIHNQKLKALEILERYQQDGVDPERILVWARIFKSANLDPKLFEEELRKIGYLKKIIIIEQRKLEKLKKEKSKTETEIRWLKTNQEELESKIKYIEKIATEKFEELVKLLLAQFIKANNIATDSVNSTKNSAIKNIQEIKEKTEQNIKEITDELEQSIRDGLSVSETIAKYESLNPLYELISESKFETHITIPAVVVLLEKLKTQIKKYSPSSSTLHYLEQLIKYLKEELEKK